MTRLSKLFYSVLHAELWYCSLTMTNIVLSRGLRVIYKVEIQWHALLSVVTKTLKE